VRSEERVPIWSESTGVARSINPRRTKFRRGEHKDRIRTYHLDCTASTVHAGRKLNCWIGHLDAGVLVWAAILASAALPGRAQNAPTVRRVQVLGNRNPLEIEIEGSAPLVPEAQILTGPDRLVVDFANAVPAAQLHKQTLNRADVKSVRVGLFAAKPPVTRVV